MNEERYASRDEKITQGHKDIVNAIKALDGRLGKVEDIVEQIKPYIEATAGLGVLSKIFFALGGIAVTWLAIKNVFHP